MDYVSPVANRRFAEPPSNRDDLMWLCGILEGEGCFGNWPDHQGRRRPHLALAMTDKDVVERAALLFGCKVYQNTRKDHPRKPVYRTIISGARAAKFMLALLPFLGQRRSQKVEGILKYWIAQYL